jgi:aminoglycoside 6-adenylyltransferase
VDFHFFPVDELSRMADEQTLDEIYQRGYSILLDKDDLAQGLPPPTYASPKMEKPSRSEFHLNIDFFLYGAAQVAKLICRRDLWSVKSGDWRIKNALLQMIEWHARARHGWDYDTWHAGKYLDKWTDERTCDTLGQVFGHYDPADSWRALLVTIGLFRRLAKETASMLGYPYPGERDVNISEYVSVLYAQDQLKDQG